MRKRTNLHKPAHGFNGTVKKVFQSYGHDYEPTVQENQGVKIAGRKQRRREAKLRGKNKALIAASPASMSKQGKRKAPNEFKRVHGRSVKVVEDAAAEVRKKALQLENKHEDKVIGALEKKLFMNKANKGNKLPKSFVDSGLDYILDAVGGNNHESSDDEDDFFLKDEQSHEKAECSSIVHYSDVDSTEDCKSISECSDYTDACLDMIDDFKVNDSRRPIEDNSPMNMAQSVKRGTPSNEDDLIVSDTEDTKGPGKYIPPAKRIKLSEEQEKNMAKLSRKLKGLLNRLSESNLKLICDDVEDLYRNNSRAIMHKVIASALMDQFCVPDPSPESMIIENAMLIAVTSIRVGIEVLMHIYEVVSLKLESIVNRKDEKDGKASNNLIQLLCLLYQFKVIDCKVIVDIFCILIESFAEKDIELILEILNKVGFQMRKEDPESLKNMIKDIGSKCNDLKVGTDDGSRMSYMLSVLTAIKNNNIRKVTSYDPDEVVKRRKRLAWLTKSKANSNETMPPITLQDFLDIENIGRWWIVGSSFSGRPMLKDGKSKDQDEDDSTTAAEFAVSKKIIEAAKAQRMNTDVRRKIFYAVMGAHDYIDAFEKVMKCGLKGKQLREIANVVVDCCQRGKTYNPYYMHLLNRFCQYDRQFSISIQCTLWDRFKVINGMKKIQQENIATLMSQLISRGSLSLNCLKTVEFTEIGKVMIEFLRLFLCKLAEEVKDDDDLSQIFETLKTSKSKLVRQGLNLFLQYFVVKNEKFMSEHSHLRTAFHTMAVSLGRTASTFL